jgi:hypothetical protein
MTVITRTKKQEYTYSMKTAGVDTRDILTTFCNGRAIFYLIPPKDALSIQYLRTQFKFIFDSSIPTDWQKIYRIGIRDSKLDDFVTYERYIELDLAADGARTVQIDMNLTPLLKKDDVAYTEFEDTFGTGYCYVYIELAPELAATGTIGEMRLWKVDALFTTVGIR